MLSYREQIIEQYIIKHRISNLLLIEVVVAHVWSDRHRNPKDNNKTNDTVIEDNIKALIPLEH